MTGNSNDIHIPDAYHPNAVELNVDEARQAALDSLGLSEKVAQQGLDALTIAEAAQVGQAMSERLELFGANINAQSE